MRKLIQRVLLSAFFSLLMMNSHSFANTIINGDFQTGNFTGWDLDSDGFPGDPTTDFFLADDGAGNYQARIEADYTTNQAWFANTLYQQIDTTVSGGPNEYQLQLSFSWEFGGEDGDTINEFVVVGFNDGFGNLYGANGNLGSLLSTDIYGNGVFSTVIDYDTFANVSGWFLDFQLNVGMDYDWLGSYLLIDNVTLEAIPQISPNPTPEPSTFLLFSIGLLFFLNRKRKKLNPTFSHKLSNNYKLLSLSIFASVMLNCSITNANDLTTSEWKLSENIDIAVDTRPSFDRINDCLNLNVRAINNGMLNIINPTRLKVLSSSHKVTNADGTTEDGCPYINIDYNLFWGVEALKTISLKLEKLRAPVQIAVIAEVHTPKSVILSSIIRVPFRSRGVP